MTLRTESPALARGDSLPSVRTPIPGPRSLALAERLGRVESPDTTFLSSDFPIFWDSALGANVTDADGNIYIDMNAGFGAAAEIALAEMDTRRALWERLGALLERELPAAISDIRFNSPAERVANTLNVTIPDAEGEAVLLGLDLEGFAVGTGSACSSGAAEPSHVLQAMGRSRTETEQSIRISMHAYNTEDDVIRFVNALSRVVKSLRELLV